MARDIVTIKAIGKHYRLAA